MGNGPIIVAAIACAVDPPGVCEQDLAATGAPLSAAWRWRQRANPTALMEEAQA
jgi:hypothetical protein